MRVGGQDAESLSLPPSHGVMHAYSRLHEVTITTRITSSTTEWRGGVEGGQPSLNSIRPTERLPRARAEH